MLLSRHNSQESACEKWKRKETCNFNAVNVRIDRNREYFYKHKKTTRKFSLICGMNGHVRKSSMSIQIIEHHQKANIWSTT